MDLPGSVRDAINARLVRLSPNAHRVATIAAVVGVQAAHPLLETLAGLPPDHVLAAIDELRHERLLAETDVDGELGYEFTHPLLREVLYMSLSRARARTIHGEIADALEQRYGDRAAAHADALAVHFLNAESAAQAPRALAYLVAAGRSALDRGAQHEAGETLAAALKLAEDLPGASLETPLDLLARARQRLGDYASASVLWKRAVALATARDDTHKVAELERRLGVAAFWTGRYDDAIAHYGRGLAAAATDGIRAAPLMLARSAALLEVGRAEEARGDSHAALAIAERLGDPALLSRVHHALQLIAVWRGPADAAREHGELSLAFATQASDRAAAWAAEWALATHCGLIGDGAGTAHHLAAAAALADELRSPVLALWTDEITIEYRSAIGDWDEAIVVADRTIADARAFSQQTLLPRLLVWSSLVRFGRGDFEVATAQMHEAWTLARADHADHTVPMNVHAVVPAHVSRATWHLAHNQYAEAIAVAEAGLAIADRTGYIAWAVHRLLPIAVEGALWTQDWPRVERHSTRLRALATQLGHPLGLAWADGAVALRQMLKGDKAGSIALLERAAVALEAIPFVEHGARLRRKLADCYYESGDAESAARELRRIHDVFVKLGARPALDEVRAKMRAIGVRPPPRSTAEGAGALTPREAEIARLVAERKSNKEIAASLDISARTVGTHLSNIFTKLGVESRGELTDVVRGNGLTT
jgi:DNA-binding CsgD family transcriptional regulator